MSRTRQPVRKRALPAGETRALDVRSDAETRYGVGQDGEVEVSRVWKRRGKVMSEAEENERIKVPVFHTAPGRVRVEGSVTRNMGNFNSIKVAVAIELPCYPVESEVDECYGVCSEMVDERVQREFQIATGEFQNGQSQTAEQPPLNPIPNTAPVAR